MPNPRFNFYKASVEPAMKLSRFTELKPKHQVVIDAFDVDEPIMFRHRSVRLAYVKHERVDDYIIASLGKHAETELSGPPSTGFQPILQEEWPHVLMVINVSASQPYGQTIAIMKDETVFKEPLNQLKSLVDEIARQNSELIGYKLLLNSVSTKESFWDIVRSRQGKIQRLAFDLASPNFLNLDDGVAEGMKAAQSKYNATKAELAIENPDGNLEIPSDDKFIEQAVNYATKGAGEIKLKVKDEGTIDAKGNKVTASITTEDAEVVIEGKNVETVKAICDKLFLCLKSLD